MFCMIPFLRMNEQSAMKTLALTVAGGFALSSALAAPTAEPQLAPAPSFLRTRALSGA